MQPMLRTGTGHPLNETLGWIDACKRRGISLRVFAHRQALARIVAQTGAEGVFGETEADIAAYVKPALYASTRDPHCQPLLEFRIASRAITRALGEAWRQATPDIAVFPWAYPAIMDGVAEWLSGVPAQARPNFVFNIVQPEAGWELDGERKQARGDFTLFRFTAKRLNALLPPQRLQFTAADERLCAVVAHAAEAECALAPLPASVPPDAELAQLKEPAHSGVRIALLGESRDEKGGQLYAKIIEALTADQPQISFFVQVLDGAAAQAISAALAQRAVHAVIHAGPLSRQDYFRQMVNSDLLLMPYTAAKYAMRASGIFTEGVSCGVPAVVPAGTWLSDRLNEGAGAGEIFARTEPGEIAAAAARALARLPQLRAQARAAMAGWRKRHSVEAYVDHVLKRFAALNPN